MESFYIDGWRSYQRYTDRLPKWIAIYSTIRDDLDMKAMKAGIPAVTDKEFGQIIGILLLTARLDRPDEMPNGPEIPMDPKWVQRKAGLEAAPDLERLVTLGLLSCNRMLQDDTLHRENLYLTVQDRTGQEKTKYSEVDESITEVIEYFKSKTGKARVITSSESNRSFVRARIKEGVPVSDLKAIIDLKHRQVAAGSFDEKYLRIQTLFNGEKCQAYLAELDKQTAEPIRPQTDQEFFDEMMREMDERESNG